MRAAAVDSPPIGSGSAPTPPTVVPLEGGSAPAFTTTAPQATLQTAVSPAADTSPATSASRTKLLLLPVLATVLWLSQGAAAPDDTPSSATP